jgi:NADPH:quinone reductase-like Zn-dependent oxidoreductase
MGLSFPFLALNVYQTNCLKPIVQANMKAAIVQELGKPPVFGDFREPVVGAGEVRVSVTAAAITHVTKARAAGTHYTNSGSVPFVVGTDGVGRLDDGGRVYFFLPAAPFGSMAESTVVPSSQWVSLPDDLDDVTAAAIANPGMSAWAAFVDVAKLASGETVLVNGATGSSGRLAVQIAKHLGAKKVIATGRNVEALKGLAALGADATIPLVGDADEQEALFKPHLLEGVDVVADYLWGASAERLLAARARTEEDHRPFRFVQIGSMSGPTITLPSAVLRSSPIELMGSGIGKVPMARLLGGIGDLLRVAVPAGFQIATTPVPLSSVEKVWMSDRSDTRTVLVIGDVPESASRQSNR